MFFLEVKTTVEKYLLQCVYLILVDRLYVSLALVYEEVFDESVSTHTYRTDKVSVLLPLTISRKKYITIEEGY